MVYNGVASECEIPKEPRCYGDCSTSEFVHASVMTPPSGDGNRLCDTCNKADVCMYQTECIKAANDITHITDRTNVFIDVDIQCKKWSGKIVNFR